MPKSLYGKLVLLLLALLAVVGAVSIVLMFSTTRLYFQEVTQNVNRKVAEQVATRREILKEGRMDPKALKRLFSQLMTTHPSIEAYGLDPAGNVLAFSAPEGAVRRHSVSLAPVRDFLAGSRSPVTGDDPRSTTGKKVFSAFPVTAAEAQGGGSRDRVAGYIYVILEGEQYQSAAQQFRGSFILRQSVLFAAASLLFALVAALLLLKVLTSRLGRLAGAMESFEAGGFQEPPRLAASLSRSSDDIDRLESAFEAMAGRMARQVSQVKNVDLLRRELVANVSHDLRTPLTALQGYLETLLLKEGRLSPQEQRDFLQIATRHSERLGKLIEDLFELAKLDSDHVPLNPEPFSMAELVQDVVQKFQLSAERKGIRLEAELARELPLVSADLALMVRVIENLADNALRYTPENGMVTASVMAENGNVAVRVADNGRGISEENLPRIFNRFYRGEIGEGAKSGGAGLGLAIAKRILELHGSSLSVVSEIDRGTTFSFMLPALRAMSSSSQS